MSGTGLGRLSHSVCPILNVAMLPSGKQEEGTFKGGILADEMGMGKTIQVAVYYQAISLIMASRLDPKTAQKNGG
eukprot:2008868-Rhodomonas_salina.2